MEATFSEPMRRHDTRCLTRLKGARRGGSLIASPG